MTYLVMWKIGEEIWRTYTTDSLKSAIHVYEFKKNIYDVVEFYHKTDNSFDLISRYGKVES